MPHFPLTLVSLSREMGKMYRQVVVLVNDLLLTIDEAAHADTVNCLPLIMRCW